MKQETRLSREKVVYPNFLYIGAPKAGSTWISEVLREHPDAYIPIVKDIQFFDYNYDKGIDWYLSFFKSGRRYKAVGELSHDYYLFEEAATRIKKHLPDVRLLCCLRDPVGEILSAYFQQRKEKIDKELSFEEYAFRKQTLRISDYYFNLLPFYERFPRKKILVLFMDDFRKNPAGFGKEIFEFLGIDNKFIPLSTDKLIHGASEPRSFILAHSAYKINTVLRELGLVNFVGLMKRNKIFLKLLYRKIDKPNVPEDISEKLLKYFKERYKYLPELIGKSLPDEWFHNKFE